MMQASTLSPLLKVEVNCQWQPLQAHLQQQMLDAVLVGACPVAQQLACPLSRALCMPPALASLGLLLVVGYEQWRSCCCCCSCSFGASCEEREGCSTF